jgi:hypothetical protein
VFGKAVVLGFICLLGCLDSLESSNGCQSVAFQSLVVLSLVRTVAVLLIVFSGFLILIVLDFSIVLTRLMVVIQLSSLW